VTTLTRSAASTCSRHAATEPNLGHLIHGVDNFGGSLRGRGVELRTGAYGALRAHTGQAIGVLAGAVKAGEDGVGLQMIALRDAVDVQAQAGTLDVQAGDDVHIVSANGHVDWAAAKRISLSTADRANIAIEGGNITVQCPGGLQCTRGRRVLRGQRIFHSLFQPCRPASALTA
jgi:hypothetical protein